MNRPEPWEAAPLPASVNLNNYARQAAVYTFDQAASYADQVRAFPDIYTAARSNLTVEALNPAASDLIMFGRSRAAHELLQRLNMRWKYRIDPGVPEHARRHLPGEPELIASPVIVEIDGRKVEALAERRSNTVKLYPAHPKGTRIK